MVAVVDEEPLRLTAVRIQRVASIFEHLTADHLRRDRFRIGACQRADKTKQVGDRYVVQVAETFKAGTDPVKHGGNSLALASIRVI